MSTDQIQTLHQSLTELELRTFLDTKAFIKWYDFSSSIPKTSPQQSITTIDFKSELNILSMKFHLGGILKIPEIEVRRSGGQDHCPSWALLLNISDHKIGVVNCPDKRVGERLAYAILKSHMRKSTSSMFSTICLAGSTTSLDWSTYPYPGVFPECPQPTKKAAAVPKPVQRADLALPVVPEIVVVKSTVRNSPSPSDVSDIASIYERRLEKLQAVENELASMRRAYQDAVEKIAKQNERMRNMQSTIDNSIEALEFKDSNIRDLQSDLLDRHNDLEFLTERNLEYSQTISKLNEENSALVKEVDQSYEDKSELIERVDRLKGRLTVYEDAVSVFQTGINALLGIMSDPYKGVLQRLMNTLMHALNGNINASYSRILQANRNRLMHAINGNIDNSGTNPLYASLKPKPLRIKEIVTGPTRPKTIVYKDVGVAPTVRIRPKSKAKQAKANANPQRREVMKPSNRAPNLAAELRANLVGVSRLVAMVARMIALPGEDKPTRIRVGLTATKTAITAPYRKIPVPWTNTNMINANANNPSGIGPTDFVCFLFRGYLSHVIYLDPNSSPTTTTGGQIETGIFNFTNTVFGSEDTSDLPFTPSPSATFSLGLAARMTIPVTHLDYSNSTYKPHGTYLYPKTFDGKPGGPSFWFAHAGDILDLGGIVSTNNVVNGQVSFYLSLVEQATVIQDFITLPVPPTTAGQPLALSKTLPKTGYYSLEVHNSEAAPAAFVWLTGSGSNLTQLVGSGAARWCHLSVRDFNLNSGSVGSVAVLGTSVCYSNRAALGGRAGNISTGLIPPGNSWMSQATIGYQTIASQEGFDENDVVSGRYKFLPPQTINSLDLQTCHSNSNGNYLSAFSPIIEKDPFMLLWASIPLPSTSNVLSPQMAELTVHDALSFTSLDTWRDEECADASRAEVEEAMRLVTKLKDSYENPLHIMEILKGIGGAFKGASRFAEMYGPRIIKGLGTVSSLL